MTQVLTPETVIDLRSGHPVGSPAARSAAVGTLTTARLSGREVEVMKLVAEGLDTTEVAEQLGYSESTIKGVLAKVMGRLEARNRCHAVAIAVRDGLI